MTRKDILLIKKALFEVEMNEVKYMDSFPQIDLPHSQQYIDNMSNLTSPQVLVNKSRLFPKKKLLICVIAVILLFATACACREPILDFFEEIYESFTKLSTKEDSDEKVGVIYMPNYLPAGYEQVAQNENQLAFSVTWSNGENKIIYSQSPLNNENALLDTETNDYIAIFIDEQPVYYILKNNTYFFIWENDHYSFKLKCTDSLPKTEIELIISSIHKQQ